jgi:hypothetical protein
MRLRLGFLTCASALFVAGAVGVLGAWALASAVVLVVGTAVATAIVWEDRDAERQELVPVRSDRR